MRAIHIIALLPVITVLCCGQEEGAPKNELAFGLGGLPSLSRSEAPSLNAGPGTGLQVNYGRRFLDGNKLALYGEINFLASPLREVSSSVTSATQNFASLYVHARSAAESFSEVQDLAVPGHRRRIRGL
jgi:hypothetical protein